eukprot:g4214.t1
MNGRATQGGRTRGGLLLEQQPFDFDKRSIVCVLGEYLAHAVQAHNKRRSMRDDRKTFPPLAAVDMVGDTNITQVNGDEARHTIDVSDSEDAEKYHKDWNPTTMAQTDGESRAAVDVHDSDDEQDILRKQKQRLEDLFAGCMSVDGRYLLIGRHIVGHCNMQVSSEGGILFRLLNRNAGQLEDHTLHIEVVDLTNIIIARREADQPFVAIKTKIDGATARHAWYRKSYDPEAIGAGGFLTFVPSADDGRSCTLTPKVKLETVLIGLFRGLVTVGASSGLTDALLAYLNREVANDPSRIDGRKTMRPGFAVNHDLLKVQFTYGDVRITMKDMKIADGPNQVNDSIMDFWLSSWFQRHNWTFGTNGSRGCNAAQGTAKCMSSLVMADELNGNGMTEKLVTRGALLDNHAVFFPYSDANHWSVFAVVRLSDASTLGVFHCDSMKGLHSTKTGGDLIQALYLRTLGEDCPDLADAVSTPVPGQEDSWSCGYHAMANIQTFCLRWPRLTSRGLEGELNSVFGRHEEDVAKLQRRVHDLMRRHSEHCHAATRREGDAGKEDDASNDNDAGK